MPKTGTDSSRAQGACGCMKGNQEVGFEVETVLW